MFTRRLHGTLAAAADRGPQDFAELLLVPGVGARTVQALAMVAEVVHGAPCRFTDPARFSFAHGGKDRHPFPVPIKVMTRRSRVLKSARAERPSSATTRSLPPSSGSTIRRAGLNGPPPARRCGADRGGTRPLACYGGRSVFGWEPPSATSVRPRRKCRERHARSVRRAGLPGIASRRDLVTEAEEQA